MYPYDSQGRPFPDSRCSSVNVQASQPRREPDVDAALLFLESYQDVFDDHIDEFCRLAPFGGHQPPSRKALHRLLRGNADTFACCLSLCLSRVAAIPIPPLASAPGRMCARMIRGLLTEPASVVTRSLIARVSAEYPRAWMATIDALAALELDSRGWSVWPSSPSCQRALAAINAIGPAWSAAVAQLQTELRSASQWKGRSHTFRRAVRQWSLLEKVLRCVSIRRGDLRLLFEYLSWVWLQYRTDRPSGSIGDGSYELLVLEVLTFIVQLWDTDASAITSVPRLLEQRGPNRRQRIQRARLRLYSAWQPGSDDEWLDCILPTLESPRHDA